MVIRATKKTISALVVLTTCTFAPASEAVPIDVIFYGNSLTLGTGSPLSVDRVFQDIATAAGHETPFVVSAATSGQDLNWHLNNNTQRIFTGIAPDNDWEFIVMQEHSTKLTEAFTGSPSYPESVEQSKSSASGLYQVAAGRSPDVVPVLFETWARGPGHAFYDDPSPTFPGGPSQMQAQVRDGNNELKAAIDSAAGIDLARTASVGDVWESAGYDNLHASDLWHAQSRGTLLAALVIYSTVYLDPTTGDIDLGGVLTSLGLTASDGTELSGYADSRFVVQVPEPASAWLLGLGVLILIGCRRKNKRLERELGNLDVER